jgi:autoinducer 2 (AI-2) kinase
MADRSPYLAALDYGTGGGKCVIFDAGGRCIAVAREAWTYTPVATDSQSPVHGYAFDANAFWAAIARCTRRALDESGIEPAEIAGVSTTAQRLGSVFLDAWGSEVYAGPNMDGRGFPGAMEIIGQLGMERVIQFSGHWPPFVSSLARLLAYRSTPTNPPVAQILTLNDWMAYRLTGELASEPSNACESLLLDVNTRQWAAEVLETFAVDSHMLPRLVEPGAPVGAVSRAGAADTGLRAGTPVFAGGGDTQCALLGSAVVDVGEGGAVLGTTTPVMVAVDKPEFDLTGRLWTGCHVLADRWTIESNAGDTGIAYEWLVETLGLEGAHAFRNAEELMTAVPAEPQTVFSIAGPQIFDLMNFNPNRPLAIIYRYPLFTDRPKRGTFLRAFQENVACAIRANLEQIEAVRGTPTQSLTLSGGMTRSTALLASFARILRVPLLVSEEPNATALGAAVLAAAGSGVHPGVTQAAQAMVRRHPLRADVGFTDAYEAYYARWRELYATLHAMSL